MKILIYGNRKQDDEIYDAGTPEKEDAAFRAIFKMLDEEWQVYCDVSGVHKKLYDEAKRGDVESMKKLMKSRASFEYEEIRTGMLIDATQAVTR